MLFYTQLKREFTPAVWRSGQIHFREDRVQHVRKDGNRVVGNVRTPQAPSAFSDGYDVEIIMGRGTILESDCSCSEVPGVQGRRCEHVAALSVWIVERGSLLRAGIGTLNQGIAARDDDKNVLVLNAEAVAFVRGIFQNRALSAVSVEPALRYRNPESEESEMLTLNRLVKTSEFRTWRTPQGTQLKLSNDFVPILQSVENAKLVFQGQACLENLATLLEKRDRRDVVFHEDISHLEYDPDPLRLVSMVIGSKRDQSRQLTYEFRNKNTTLSSSELRELSTQGKLSNNFVWKGHTLHRFETSLAVLAQYANRTGVAAAESNSNMPFAPDGFGYLFDDEAHPLHPLAAYRLSLEMGVDEFIVDPDWTEFHEWKKNFEKKRIPTLNDVDYGFDLRDYQKNGLSWLWSLYHRGLSALLADDMGLGKTHQVLAFFSTIYHPKSRIRQPSLVIAPTSVLAAWGQKLKKYDTGLKWRIFHGNSRELPEKDVHLVLTTYGILQREEALRDREWHVIALDEAQAIKNASTISSRATRMLRCKFRIALTGTPVENQAADLWSIMEFLLPGYLGSLQRFKRLYGTGRERLSENQAKALKRLISPFLLRRTKSQVLKELPEKTEEVILCEMTPAQKKAYRDHLNSAEAAKARESIERGGRIDYANILALLTRLKQTCDHPRLPQLTSGKVKKIAKVDPLETGKWEAFSELVQEALGSELKVVVFTQYLGMMDMIGHFLESQGVGYTELRGDSHDRPSRLERFANDPDCKVFVCSLLAGGLGIDLTAGSVCIHFDRWWNPAKENQATDRLHRIGQTRGVQVFKLQIPGTVEDRIASIIGSKMELSGALIEESPLGLKAFSRQELLELLTPMD